MAWCVVPFDAKKRNPAQRAEMLASLGLKRCAYDWRKEHVPAFEEEILQYQKHGIEYFAFWSEHEEAFQLFAKHGLKPQIWKTLRSPQAETQEAKIKLAVASMKPLVEKTAQMGSKLGLYNHGGWGGQPANLIAVCEAFHELGHTHVGIVYNFHHAHYDIDAFKAEFSRLQPHLLCLNLNGMIDPATGDAKKHKILAIGQGDLEQAMIEFVIRSGYEGPVGILGHVGNRDVEVVLQENLGGLEEVLAAIAATQD